MEDKVRKENNSKDEVKAEKIEITNTNVDVGAPEERPGIGYEIYNVGIGTDN